MAWDALAGQFQRRKEEDNAMGVEKRQVSGGGAPQATATPNQPFTNGQGGSAGAPVSSRFVNFGTLYDANKDKAAGMARGVHDSAQAKADKAKGSLANAMSQFNAKAQQGTAKGTIGGAHGTRVDNYNPDAPGLRPGEGPINPPGTPPKKSTHYSATPVGPEAYKPPAKRLSSDGTASNVVIDYSALDAEAAQTRRDGARRKAMTAGAQRYASLYGPYIDNEQMGAENAPIDKEALKDYHHSVDLLGAKSGAGQAYTGPGSLKESMGDEGYGQLQDELRKAEEAAANLQNAGGIGAALGYGPADPTGLSALDTGLTQVAGQENFKRLGDKTKGLKDTLLSAQADSAKTAAGQGAISEQAAKEWQALVDEYEAAQAADAAANAPKEDNTWTEADAIGWAAFSGQGDLATSGNQWAGDIASNFGFTKASPYKDLKDAGYTDEQIRAAWKKYRSRGTGNASPTTKDLMAILTGGA